ncbi:MAG: hypothetical protein CMI60_18060 [Parvibaculum sp.]|mgnify:CR=1 FL=1|nr:hypothetical protein [Parvibaculum sp.]
MRTQLDPVTQVVELPAAAHGATSPLGDLLPAIATAGGVLTNLRAVVVSNDHASDRAYIKTAGVSADRGICLVAGDSVLLARPSASLRYQGTVSVGLMY